MEYGSPRCSQHRIPSVSKMDFAYSTKQDWEFHSFRVQFWHSSCRSCIADGKLNPDDKINTFATWFLLESGGLGCGVPGPDRQMDMFRHVNERKEFKLMPGTGGLDASREKYSPGVGHEERQTVMTGIRSVRGHGRVLRNDGLSFDDGRGMS